jgi:hypothetical protein
MKRNYILFIALLVFTFACNKDYKAVKKISGNWKLTSLIRDGVSEDLNILKITIESNYDVGDSWFGYYIEKNVSSSGTPYTYNEDLHIEFSNKGKTATFNYKYGSITGWSEVYDVVKLKKNYMELKFVGEENYYVFER